LSNPNSLNGRNGRITQPALSSRVWKRETYLKNLPAIFGPGVHNTAYSYDMYLSISSSSPNEAKQQGERVLEIHNNFPLSSGMRTNVSMVFI